MANHKSALKRIRSNEAKRVLNRYQHKSTRTAIKRLREATDKTAAQAPRSGSTLITEALPGNEQGFSRLDDLENRPCPVSW